jgi:hypothetical protein
MNLIRRASLLLVALLLAAPAAAQDAAAMADAIKNSANPDLIGALTKEMGGTVAQASGAAGALFGLAKTRLKPEEFTKVASAVPGMDSLLAAAPAISGAAGTSGIAAAAGGSNPLGGLSSLAPAFDKLGIKPETAMKAVPVITNYVTKSGGKEIGSLLASVLK